MKLIEIKELRESIGLSQTKFAQLFGVSTSIVSYWEKGERNPQLIYEACLTKLQEKVNNTNDKEELAKKIKNFLLSGGMIEFLILIFND